MRSYNQSKKNKNTTVLNTKKEANTNSEKNINVNIQNPKDSISNRIFTIVIPSISTLIAAIMSMYVLNIAEKEKVNEKNQQADIKIIEAYTTQIKANTDQNKVILDYISLENEKGELAQEISDYKAEKGKLKDENTKLEHGIASLKLEKNKTV